LTASAILINIFSRSALRDRMDGMMKLPNPELALGALIASLLWVGV